MWSLGVIVFMLLSGYPPFYGRTEEKMILLIENGRYHMRSDRWDRISHEAKDFVKRLLEMDEHKRLTADQALRHPWVIDRARASTTCIGSDVVDFLRSYACQTHLKRAVLCTIAYTLDSSEINDLREIFIQFDRQKSGTISLPDFKHCLQTLNKNVTTEEIRRIWHCLDHDHHGSIEYSEFIAAMLQQKVGLKDGLIRDAFDKFDQDHKGYLTAKNLEDVLGEAFEDTLTKDLIGEACHRSNDIIYYDEFVEHIKSPSAFGLNRTASHPSAAGGRQQAASSASTTAPSVTSNASTCSEEDDMRRIAQLTTSSSGILFGGTGFCAGNGAAAAAANAPETENGIESRGEKNPSYRHDAHAVAAGHGHTASTTVEVDGVHIENVPARGTVGLSGRGSGKRGSAAASGAHAHGHGLHLDPAIAAAGRSGRGSEHRASRNGFVEKGGSESRHYGGSRHSSGLRGVPSSGSCSAKPLHAGLLTRIEGEMSGGRGTRPSHKRSVGGHDFAPAPRNTAGAIEDSKPARGE
jgi:calcium-dependent protein kinase